MSRTVAGPNRLGLAVFLLCFNAAAPTMAHARPPLRGHVEFFSPRACDTCATRLCPWQPIHVRVGVTRETLHRWALLPSGQGAPPRLRIVNYYFGGWTGPSHPDGGSPGEVVDGYIEPELPGLPPGDFRLSVEYVDSMAFGWFVSVVSKRQLYPFRVEPKCPIDPPPYVHAIRVGPPLSEGQPIPVEIEGDVPDVCRRFERAELLATGPGETASPPVMRLVFSAQECGGAPCRMGENRSFAANVTLPALPAGTYQLPVQTEVLSLCEGSRVLEAGMDSVQFRIEALAGAPKGPGAPPVLEVLGPNPFAGGIAFRLALPNAGRVRVLIHDLAGRRVATLHDGPLAGGPHTLVWNGVSDGGQPAHDGIYLASVRAGQRLVARRVVLRR